MFYRIVSIVFPLFAVVMLGFLYARKHNPDMTAANRMNMEIFMPALIFAALAGKSFNLADNVPIALGAAGTLLLEIPAADVRSDQLFAVGIVAMVLHVGFLGITVPFAGKDTPPPHGLKGLPDTADAGKQVDESEIGRLAVKRQFLRQQLPQCMHDIGGRQAVTGLPAPDRADINRQRLGNIGLGVKTADFGQDGLHIQPHGSIHERFSGSEKGHYVL